MKNENSLIGLFQGMFEGNILTFNPGWDENANNLEEFDDVREIQREPAILALKFNIYESILKIKNRQIFYYEQGKMTNFG